jgi:hypothetical protein
MVRIAFFMLLVVSHTAGLATIHHVPGQFSTIQEAINSSVDGDTVLVAPGTYTENINFRGRNILVASEFVFDMNPQTIVETIINGGSPANPDTGSCVIINSGEDTTAVLEGFTLTAGVGTKWVDEHGAGAYTEGGGILIQYSSPTIRHNRIIGNFAINVPAGVTSGGGGGMRVGDSTPRILNNIIMDNEGLYGGGIVLNYSGGIVKNNIIVRNRVYPAAGSAPTFGGGGVWILEDFGSSQKVVENNTIVENSSAGSGGGVAGRGGGILVWGTTVIVRNNVVWDNTQTIGGQIFVTAGTALVTYSDVEGGYSGTGNINLDPQFADTSFYLQSGSPCIDSGDTNTSRNDSEDPLNPGFALWPAQGGLRSDMGAYGGPGSSVLGSFPVTGVGEEVSGGVPSSFRLHQNYPNPFNPATTITFSLPVASFASLDVFDLLGQKVATLVGERLPPGTHVRSWDASGFPAGVYVYRLTTPVFSQSRKMIVLK